MRILTNKKIREIAEQLECVKDELKKVCDIEKYCELTKEIVDAEYMVGGEYAMEYAIERYVQKLCEVTENE